VGTNQNQSAKNKINRSGGTGKLNKTMNITTKKISKKLFTFLPAIIFISDELIATYIRPVFGLRKFGLISNILGWLPNFNAGLGMTLLGGIIISEVVNKVKIEVKLKIALILFVLIMTIFLLVRHEINQIGTGLCYDIADIYATIIGSILGTLISIRYNLKTPVPANI
jgi:hypothetical protein